MYHFILVYLFSKAFNNGNLIVENEVKRLYKQSKRAGFNIKYSIVKVKKGKRRYRILFYETKEQTHKIMLSRHFDACEININN